MAKKRCVAYARVSTDKKDQLNSLQNQKTYFQRELERNNDIRLVHMNISGLCEDGYIMTREEAEQNYTALLLIKC